jgi:peptide/nickel transport system permease protein
MTEAIAPPPAAAADADAGEVPIRRQTRRDRFRAVMLADKKALVGMVILAGFLLLALVGPFVVPYDPNEMTLDMMAAPSLAHPLGTDDLGRDLVSRLVVGTQVSLFIGVTTVAISLVVGVFLGVLAGYRGGWIDQIIMRYIDLQWAFPNFIIAVYLVAVFGTGMWNLIIAISLAFVDDFARIARGMVLSIRQEQYVQAARTVGASDLRIMLRHILPNATAPIIVQATVSVSYAILAEASLSFLGLGVEASTPTWGLILAESRSFISRAWWLGIFPGVAIMLTVLSINFIGDALRDFLDVRETAGSP